MQTHGDFSSENYANILSKSTIMAKCFKIGNIKCDYRNVNTITTNNSDSQSSKLMISNYLCKQQNNTLKKVTQIKFGKKLITLTDEYTIQGVQLNIIPQIYMQNQAPGEIEIPSKIPTTKDKKMNKKQFFHKKPIGSRLQRVSQKRDTKNIVKNFIKAFYRFCQQNQNHDYALKIKEIMGKFNFNNSMVEKITLDYELVNPFQNFLRNEVQQWIQTSKIRDKDAHKEAARIYLDLITRSKQSPQMSTNKETNQQIDRASQDKGSQS